MTEYTLKEAAEMIGVSIRTLQREIRAGKFPDIRRLKNRQLRIPESNLNAYKQEQRKPETTDTTDATHHDTTDTTDTTHYDTTVTTDTTHHDMTALSPLQTRVKHHLFIDLKFIRYEYFRYEHERSGIREGFQQLKERIKAAWQKLLKQ
jgi:excisionase family DNA binding protein